MAVADSARGRGLQPPPVTRERGGWLLYVLRCADGSLYTGITNDLDRRLKRHSAKKGSRYTRSRLPVELLWTRACASGQVARSLERRVKAMTRADKLRVIEGRTRL